MASLVARALLEEHRHVPSARADSEVGGVERILLTTFWRPSPRTTPARVVSITARRILAGTPPTR